MSDYPLDSDGDESFDEWLDAEAWLDADQDPLDDMFDVWMERQEVLEDSDHEDWVPYDEDDLL